jgi:hypothetical protein
MITSATAPSVSLPRRLRTASSLREQLPRLVGGAAQSTRELLHSTLATSIVHQYLGIVAGDSRLGTADVPYFDSPVKQVTTAGVLLDLKRFKPKRADR